MIDGVGVNSWGALELWKDEARVLALLMSYAIAFDRSKRIEKIYLKVLKQRWASIEDYSKYGKDSIDRDCLEGTNAQATDIHMTTSHVLPFHHIGTYPSLIDSSGHSNSLCLESCLSLPMPTQSDLL